MKEEIFVAELPNGMVLLGEPMANVASASLLLAVPAGAAYDPPAAGGAASVACEWSVRGAGLRSTRQLNEALDALGCHHDQHVQSEHVLYSAAQLGRHLPEALSLQADILLRPRLDGAAFGPSRELVRQDLASLADEPAQLCMTRLAERFYPAPFGRCIYGSDESLASLAAAPLRDAWRRVCRPEGTILAVAGAFDWPAVCEQAERLFGGWTGRPLAEHVLSPAPRGVLQLTKDTAQTHIGLAHAAPPIGHRCYYASRLAETVLSGGAGSRLHTEVREKRGLAYHVASHYHGLKGMAGMFTYAAATPPLAEQTFELVVAEIRRLGEGASDEELTRARTQLKSALIMQNEATGARAAALASDWFHLRRVRTFEEIARAVEAVSAGDVVECLREFPAADFAVVTIGPEALDTSGIADCGTRIADLQTEDSRAAASPNPQSAIPNPQ